MGWEGGETPKLKRFRAGVENRNRDSVFDILLPFSGMLSARKIQDVLNNGTVDGIDGLCLLSLEGSILASAFSEKARLILNEQQMQEVPIASIFPDEIAMGAIACTVWTQYSSGMKLWIWFLYISFFVKLFFFVNV